MSSTEVLSKRFATEFPQGATREVDVTIVSDHIDLRIGAVDEQVNNLRFGVCLKPGEAREVAEALLAAIARLDLRE